MTDGEMVLTALGGQAVLLAVLGFLGRAVATHWLDKDLRTFEAKLKAAANESVANMTHELEKAKLEHQVRFSKLHERRADIIAEVYRLLAYFYASSASYASSIGFEGDLPRPEQLKMADLKLPIGCRNQAYGHLIVMPLLLAVFQWFVP